MGKFKRFFIHASAIIVFPFYYPKIHRLRQKGESLILLLPKFGDMTYGMLYVNQFKKESGRKIVCFCCEKNVEYVKSYGCVDRIITYPNKLFYQSLLYSLSGVRYFFIRKCVKKDVLHTVPPQAFFHMTNCCDIYRDVVFSLKEDKFQLYKPAERTKVTAIENFEEIKDKVVVLNAFTTSHIRNCDEILQKTADLLQSKGYIVYSNVVGNQQPIKGTKALNCSINELYEICDNIKAFISIRSGITDIILGSKCQKIILYMKRNLLKMHAIAKFNSNVAEQEILKKKDEEAYFKLLEEKIK